MHKLLDPEQYERWIVRSVEAAKTYSLPVMLLSGSNLPAVGSGCLIHAGKGDYLVTAGHVVAPLEGFGDAGRLQIGWDRFTVRDALLRLEVLSSPDIALMRLHADEVRMTRARVLPVPRRPRAARKDRFVACVGLRGSTKKLAAHRRLNLTRYELFGIIETVQPDQFSIRVDDGRYEAEGDSEAEEKEISDIGGISGAPILSTTERPQLVGVVHEGMAWGTLEQKIYAVHSGVLFDLDLFEAADRRFDSRPPPARGPGDRPLPRVLRLKDGPAHEVHTFADAVRLLHDVGKADLARSPWKECGDALVVAANTGAEDDLRRATDSLEQALLGVGWLADR